MNNVTEACARRAGAILELTRALAAIESPSNDAAALERCAEYLVAQLTTSGATVTRPSGATVAHVLAKWPGSGSRVLLLGHFDTVYPLGQIARQPVEARDGRLFGPGVYDMKAGLSIAINAAVVTMEALPVSARPALTLLATSDEEVGSGSSRDLIETIARDHDAVLVLEPALASGAVKTARKGVGEFEIVAHGVSAHAGVEPDAGASAIHEIARLIVDVRALADPSRGLTVNVGVVEGGTRPNVIAEHARALVDVRISKLEDAARIEEALRALRAYDKRVSITVTGGVNRPPMERGPGVARLFDLARGVAADHGWDLREGSTGGGSDGNFTAALGVPTLDGLGGVGDGAHAIHEHVVIKDLPVRTALLAGLLVRLGDNGWTGAPRERGASELHERSGAKGPRE